MGSKRIPTHLKHKPILAVESYDNIDGPYKGNTDAKGLSLGGAQWDNDELSLKVWRHTDEKWSRQSEELPLHRVLDLATLLCKALGYAKSGELKPSPDFNVTILGEQEQVQAMLKSLSLELEKDSNINIALNRLKQAIEDID